MEVAARNSTREIVLPPLKWAGGKRWFASRHLDLIPKDFDNYIEPFLGSGALYFALKPKRAVLSDLNPDLINFYEVLRSEPALLRRKLLAHEKAHGDEYYYRVRDSEPRADASRAAKFLYLNRACWNGLYRVNSSGKFNVPKGTKTSVLLPGDNFEALSQLLVGANLSAGDFSETLRLAGRGDFVFIDPPYTVAHNNNGFLKYNEKIFSWSDQVRLREGVDRAVVRGAKVLVTNAAHVSIQDLYRDFKQINLTRSGVIAGKSSARGNFSEVIIQCF